MQTMLDQSSEPIAFRPSTEARVSCADDRIALLHVGTGRVFVANKIGARTWRGMAAGRSLPEIAEELGREFGEAPERTLQDAEEFLKALQTRGLIHRRYPARRAKGPVMLLLAAILALLIYDLKMALFGFGRIYKDLEQSRIPAADTPTKPDGDLTATLEGLSRACSFYWKPVRCLQRSVVLTRQLRKAGIPADVVISYRTVPFFSHAWVEVNGRVVNDSQGYSRNLTVLARL